MTKTHMLCRVDEWREQECYITYHDEQTCAYDSDEAPVGYYYDNEYETDNDEDYTARI